MKNLRLRISEYFDTVVNQIDLFTETKITHDNRLEQSLNERREQQLQIVRNVERVTLARVDRLDLNDNEQNILERSFASEFCFTVELAEFLFLVKVNRYLSPNEIDVFKTFLKWKHMSDQERHSFLTNQNSCFEVDHYWIGDETSLEEMFTNNSILVDSSSWFNRSHQLQKLVISRVNPAPLFQPSAVPIRINTIEVILFGYIRMSLEDAVEKIKLITECYGQVDNIIVHVENFSFSQIKDLEHVVRWDDRVRVRAYCKSAESRTASTRDLSHTNWLKMIQLTSAILNSAVTLVWPHIEELNLHNCTLRSIDSATFTNTQHLRHFTLSHCELDKTSMEHWSFLDPIRSCLESLQLVENKLDKISWKLFRDMVNLKLLVIHETDMNQVELDENGQLFGDLTSLSKLVLRCQINSSIWFCRLPLLQQLDLYLVNFKNLPIDGIHISSNYKLPRLADLRVHIDEAYEQKDLPIVLTAFSHVKQLLIELPGSEVLSNGLLKEFKHLTKLTLESQNSSRTFTIDGEMFNGLKSLTELELIHPTKLAPDALRNLSSLQSIAIRSRGIQLFELDKLTSFFDGLWSLRKVDYSFFLDVNQPTTKLNESFVYFENLNKFVLVTSGLSS